MNGKSIILSALLVCAILFTNYNAVSSSHNEHNSLTDVITIMLSDPDFLTMGDQEQLRVLQTIYTMLEDHRTTDLKNQQQKKQKPLRSKLIPHNVYAETRW